MEIPLFSPQYPSPHLKKVLRSYQSAASNSLSGPSAVLEPAGPSAKPSEDTADLKPCVLVDEFQTLKLKRHRQAALGPPILTTADRQWSECSETVLEGHGIACFVVGGEKRLCLPQVLNSALRQFHITEINPVCDDLRIYCSLCTPEQLEILKGANILPPNAAACGLITKTDAERLCSTLLRRPSSRVCRDRSRKDEQPGWFRVYHECFGKCEGICKPELYTTPISPCVECADCGMLLSPQYFVGHAHRSLQKRTCHWGFDSTNWRDYLLLARRQPQPAENLVSQLEAFKQKFAASAELHVNVTSKRKQQVEEVFKQDAETMVTHKKCKEEEEDGGELAQQPFAVDPTYVYSYLYPDWSVRTLATPQWAGRDSPPLLQHNYRFEADKLDKSYQPNVALAPPKTRLLSLPTPPPAPPRLMMTAPLTRNPEIELSSTDSEDSELAKLEEVDLTPELSRELRSVEELLRQGGCDEAFETEVLQSFRKLCVRLMWSEEELRKKTEATSNHDPKWTENSPRVRLPVKLESENY